MHYTTTRINDDQLMQLHGAASDHNETPNLLLTMTPNCDKYFSVIWMLLSRMSGDWMKGDCSHAIIMDGDYLDLHYNDVIMGAIASQITSLTIIYSTVYSGADQRKRQSSASLAFVWGIHRGPVNSPHKWPVTQKMFSFDDVIMWTVNWGDAWWAHSLFNLV